MNMKPCTVGMTSGKQTMQRMALMLCTQHPLLGLDIRLFSTSLSPFRACELMHLDLQVSDDSADENEEEEEEDIEMDLDDQDATGKASGLEGSGGDGSPEVEGDAADGEPAKKKAKTAGECHLRS